MEYLDFSHRVNSCSILWSVTAGPFRVSISKHFRTTRHRMKRSSNGRFTGVKRGSIWFPLKMRSSLNLAIKPEESSQSIFFTHPCHTQDTQTYVTIMRFHPTLSPSPTSNFSTLEQPGYIYKNIFRMYIVLGW